MIRVVAVKQAVGSATSALSGYCTRVLGHENSLVQTAPELISLEY